MCLTAFNPGYTLFAIINIHAIPRIMNNAVAILTTICLLVVGAIHDQYGLPLQLPKKVLATSNASDAAVGLEALS